MRSLLFFSCYDLKCAVQISNLGPNINYFLIKTLFMNLKALGCPKLDNYTENWATNFEINARGTSCLILGF